MRGKQGTQAGSQAPGQAAHRSRSTGKCRKPSHRQVSRLRPESLKPVLEPNISVSVWSSVSPLKWHFENMLREREGEEDKRYSSTAGSKGCRGSRQSSLLWRGTTFRSLLQCHCLHLVYPETQGLTSANACSCQRNFCIPSMLLLCLAGSPQSTGACVPNHPAQHYRLLSVQGFPPGKPDLMSLIRQDLQTRALDTSW